MKKLFFVLVLVALVAAVLPTPVLAAPAAGLGDLAGSLSFDSNTPRGRIVFQWTVEEVFFNSWWGGNCYDTSKMVGLRFYEAPGYKWTISSSGRACLTK